MSMSDDSPRDIPEIPEKVTHTMLLLFEFSRKLLVRKLLGGGLGVESYPNCHELSRAYSAVLTHLEVTDGAVVTLEDEGFVSHFHSWLVFKEHPEFGIDVAPFGAVPLFTVPNLLFFDRHALMRRGAIPQELVAGAEERGRPYRELLAEIGREIRG